MYEEDPQRARAPRGSHSEATPSPIGTLPTAMLQRKVQRRALARRGAQAQLHGQAGPVVQRSPGYLVGHSFLGVAVGGGVHSTLKQRLGQAETQLQGLYDALPEDERISPITGEKAQSLKDWCGIREAHGGWRPRGGLHSSGSAIDINYTTNPYIATRSDITDKNGSRQKVYGGEAAGAGLQSQRRSATEVYDRAAQFATYAPDAEGQKANVGARKKDEKTGAVYDRFRKSSDALKTYFAPAFKGEGPTKVNRAPVPDPEKATQAQLLKGIPESERKPEADARSDIQTILDSEWSVFHESWPYQDVDSLYLRMLRDYELVRVPMVFGNPSARPGSTRNPSKGFMDLRKELVEALCDNGKLRWGASDFGEAESGDMMHFDLGYHAAAPSDTLSARGLTCSRTRRMDCSREGSLGEGRKTAGEDRLEGRGA